MNKYCVYKRVSTKEQGQSGLGLASQEQMVLPIVSNGIVVGTFTEIESGNKSNRKELEKAIAMCKQENAILVVAKLDRLSRNVHFISTLMESKVKFICSDMPECDSFTINIFGAMAQREREMISERTAAGLNSIKRQIAENGEYITKAGNTITSLGSPKMQNEKYAKVQMSFVARNRVYTKKSPIGIELIKSYSQNGVEAKEIKQRLAANGIELSLKTIYSYKKAV